MVDRNFPRNPKEIESRLLQGGTPYSAPVENVSDSTSALQYETTQKNARDKAERAGVLTIIRPKPRSSAHKPTAEIFDVGNGMDMDSFIVKFDEHFEIAHGIYLDLMSKSLAYTSAAQVLQHSLSQIDQFKDLDIDLTLITRIVRLHMVTLFCEKLNLDPRIFYPDSSAHRREPATAKAHSSKDFDLLLQGLTDMLENRIKQHSDSRIIPVEPRPRKQRRSNDS